MGCCNEKLACVKNRYHELSSSSEEEIIRIKEKSLPFSSMSAIDIIALVKKYEYEGMLSAAQLRNCLAEMNIESDAFSGSEGHITNLFVVMQNSKKLYDTNIIEICGILLGEGKSKEKAEALFKIYDKDASDIMNRDVAEKMIEDVIDVAAGRLPLVAVDDSELPEVFTLPRAKLESYKETMLNNKKTHSAKLLNCLLAEEKCIYLAEFIKKVSSSSLLESLLWSYLTRQGLLTPH